jgi:hypothetical protein
LKFRAHSENRKTAFAQIGGKPPIPETGTLHAKYTYSFRVIASLTFAAWWQWQSTIAQELVLGRS